MGSPPGEAGRSHDEGPLHEVTQDAFACMRHPVTRGLYRKLMPEVKRYWPEKDADDWPANGISWYDAVQFCNRLSDEDGLARCYEIEGTNVTWQHTADGYRLPTESEWEYSRRAGSEAMKSCEMKRTATLAARSARSISSYQSSPPRRRVSSQ